MQTQQATVWNDPDTRLPLVTLYHGDGSLRVHPYSVSLRGAAALSLALSEALRLAGQHTPAPAAPDSAQPKKGNDQLCSN
jgi:hypothetical protein